MAPFWCWAINQAVVQHNKIQSLRARKYKGSPEDWEEVLTKALLHTPEALDGVRVGATLPKETELVISLSRNVSCSPMQAWAKPDIN
jgi:hypothetical protein